jgi:hypothetical protein
MVVNTQNVLTKNFLPMLSTIIDHQLKMINGMIYFQIALLGRHWGAAEKDSNFNYVLFPTNIWELTIYQETFRTPIYVCEERNHNGTPSKLGIFKIVFFSSSTTGNTLR